MNKQEMEQRALEHHVIDINDLMRRMRDDLTSEIAKYKERKCLCSKCNKSFVQAVLVAYTFRQNFLDKHPANYSNAVLKFPYDLWLSKQIDSHIKEAMVLAPVLIPWGLFNKWQKSLWELKLWEEIENDESHEDINVQ